MALQTFTAGQVLTAAQVTALQANTYNQTVSTKTASYVLVAADKGTRVAMNSASATTITVNTSLFNAGDTLFIQNIGAGACTVTAGTATVSTAGSLVLAANAGGTLYFTSAGVSVFFPSAGASGLNLVKAQTIGTAVSSVNVTGAFSATYENYKIIISNGVASVTNILYFSLDGITSTYRDMLSGVNTSNAYTGVYVNGTNSFSQYSGVGDTGTLYLDVDLTAPFLAKRKFIKNGYIDTTTNIFYNKLGAVFTTTSATAFTITASSGTLTGGTIYVYGYGVS